MPLPISFPLCQKVAGLTLFGNIGLVSGEVHSEVTSLFSVAHESPLSLEEPVEVLRPRVRVVPQEQLQDERAHDGSGVDAVAGERADPFRPATVVVLGQFLGWEDKRT